MSKEAGKTEETQRTDGERAVLLITRDLSSSLQRIISLVKPLSPQVAQLDTAFIGFNFEGKFALGAQIPGDHSIRVYWYAGSDIPRVTFSFMQQTATRATYFMGEATEGEIAWWHPQAEDMEASFSILKEAFDSKRLDLGHLQAFIATIRWFQEQIPFLVANNLKQSI